MACNSLKFLIREHVKKAIMIKTPSAYLRIRFTCKITTLDQSS